MAIAGLVIGYISIALFVVSIIIAVLAATTASATCFDETKPMLDLLLVGNAGGIAAAGPPRVSAAIQ